MAAALLLSRRGLGRVWPNPAVGCVLVNEGVVVGRGWTRPGGRPHAETEAIRRAGNKAQGATAYVSLEPCDHQGQTPPCSVALVKAGVSRVVIATRDPDPRVSGKGIARLKAAGIKVCENLMEDQAQRLNLGFMLRVKNNRPMFTLKLATDREGRIPAPGIPPGSPDKWVTGPAARRQGHLLRAEHDAVLFGIGTVLDDDPEYTCRLAGMEDRSPIRVLLDSRLRLPRNSSLLETSGKAPLWVVTGKNRTNEKIKSIADIEIIVAPEVDGNDRPDLQWLAGELARRGLTRVLVESGPKLAGAFLQADLVDCIQWFRAKKDMVGSSVPTKIDIKAMKFVKTNEITVGSDTMETYNRG